MLTDENSAIRMELMTLRDVNAALVEKMRELQEDQEALIQQRDRAHAAADSQEKDLDAAYRLIERLKKFGLEKVREMHNVWGHVGDFMSCAHGACPSNVKAMAGFVEKRICEHKLAPTFDGLGVRYKCQLCNEYISE